MAKNLSGPGKKLHGWANGSREPAQCGAQYGVWENEKEYGTFTVERNGKSEEIEGHMMWKNKASVTLIWELPGSTAAAVDTFEAGIVRLKPRWYV